MALDKGVLFGSQKLCDVPGIRRSFGANEGGLALPNPSSLFVYIGGFVKCVFSNIGHYEFEIYLISRI